MPYRPADAPAGLPGHAFGRACVFAGGAALAGTAAFINVCLLGYFHVPVSHMTGAVSRLSMDVEARDVTDLRLVLSIVGAFLLGAVLSGAIVGGRHLAPGRRYGVALMVEAACLAAATALLLNDHPSGVALAAVACGVQNAMASSYYGLIIRTTHVTGIVTDLGFMIGQWARHRHIEPWKAALLATLLVAFFVGGVAGATAVRVWGMGALGIAAAGTFVAGAAYFAWRRRHTVPSVAPAPAVHPGA